MPNRNKNLQFAYTLAMELVFLLSANRAFATNGENHIQEIMAGVNGNSKVQFIVIQQEGGGNLWGPQTGEPQSRVMLVFFDAAGRETGKFKFLHNVPADANPASGTETGLLVAEQKFGVSTWAGGWAGDQAQAGPDHHRSRVCVRVRCPHDGRDEGRGTPSCPAARECRAPCRSAGQAPCPGPRSARRARTRW